MLVDQRVWVLCSQPPHVCTLRLALEGAGRGLGIALRSAVRCLLSAAAARGCCSLLLADMFLGGNLILLSSVLRHLIFFTLCFRAEWQTVTYLIPAAGPGRHPKKHLNFLSLRCGGQVRLPGPQKSSTKHSRLASLTPERGPTVDRTPLFQERCRLLGRWL